MLFSNTPSVVILGGGGHAYVVFDILKQMKIRVDYVVDPKIKVFRDTPVGVVKDLQSLKNRNLKTVNFYFGIGDFKLRGSLVRQIKGTFKSFSFPKIIHPNSIIYSNVKIGDGTQIFAGTIIGPNVTIGSFTILNHFSLIDHDSKIGNYCNLSPRVTLGGNVVIENQVFIGMGAVISNNVTISENATVGALTFLNKDLSAKSIYLGKKINQNI